LLTQRRRLNLELTAPSLSLTFLKTLSFPELFIKLTYAIIIIFSIGVSCIFCQKYDLPLLQHE